MKKLFTNLKNWCLDLLALMFNEHNRVISSILIFGLIGVILSQTFVPWANPDSYFGNQNLLFQCTVRVNDILSTIESAYSMIYNNAIDSGLLFIWLTLIGTFVAKLLSARVAKSYTHSWLSGLIIEELTQSSLFYVFSLCSFLFLSPIINAFTSSACFNEVAAVAIIILGILSAAVAIPSALYLGTMSMSLFLTYQLLSYIENDVGKIITMIIALAANLVLDYLCTSMMLKILQAILDFFNIPIDL